MDVADLRDKSVEALNEELLRLRRDHFNLRVQRASGQLPQTHLVGETRRDIARVKTILREKAQQVAVADAPEENTDD